jgi:hypothetical protein
MKGKAALTTNDARTPVERGLKIRTSLKAGKIVKNVNRTIVARKKVRPQVGSQSKRTLR